jgi:hypothetical protein
MLCNVLVSNVDWSWRDFPAAQGNYTTCEMRPHRLQALHETVMVKDVMHRTARRSSWAMLVRS